MASLEDSPADDNPGGFSCLDSLAAADDKPGRILLLMMDSLAAADDKPGRILLLMTSLEGFSC